MKMRKAEPTSIDLTTLLAKRYAATPQEDMAEFQCKLITPMFGGGVRAGEVDRAMPIRATAIRGQLRFWWRLIHRRSPAGQPLDSKALFEAERAVWGGLGAADTLARSKVVVQVESKPAASLRPAATYPEGKSFPRWENEGEAYALFGAAEAKGDANHGVKRAADLLPAGHEFQLRLVRGQGLDDGQWQGVQAALRWWAAFGGVGSRTRRGAGAVDVNFAGEPLLRPRASEIDAAGCRLVEAAPMSKPMDAWHHAVRKLREFRQAPGVGRNLGSKDNKPGRSRWPEADTLRVAMNTHAPLHAPQHPARDVFPRAMFGLPIITHFKDAKERDPPDTSLRPIPDGASAPADRMASPIVLRPLRTSAGKWAPAALLLPRRDALDRMGLALMHKEKAIKTMKAGEWWRPEKAALIPPMQALADDPLLAFMAGFARKEWPSPPTNKAGVSAPVGTRLQDHYVKFVGANDTIQIEVSGRKIKQFGGSDAEDFKRRMSEDQKTRILDGKSRGRGIKFNEIVIEGNRVLSFKEKE